MNYFSRNKWWGFFFVLLIILNMVTLAAFWIMRDKRPSPPASNKAVADFLVKELGLDSVQVQKLLDLRKTYQDSIHEVRDHNREAKNDFFSLLPNDSITNAALQQAAQKAVVYDIQTDILTFRHFQAIRKICTESQKRKFDEVIQEVLRMSAPQGPPAGRPGPPPPGADGRRPDGPPPGEGERKAHPSQ